MLKAKTFAVWIQQKRGAMKKLRHSKYLFLCPLILLMMAALFLAGCSKKKNLTYDGTDMGKLTERSVDIMGVRYNLYSNGYAEVVAVLNPYFELSESVTHEGTSYSVVKIQENNFGGVSGYGIFNKVGISSQGLVEAPEHLALPDTLLSLPGYVFAECTSSSITLPSNLKYLPLGAFYCCSNLETVEFPDSLEKICAVKLFTGCSSLTSVELPKDVSYVLSTDYLFSGCSSLQSVTIPGACGGGVLDERTFADCDVLSEIILEDGITTIGFRTFHNLPALEEIVFPDSVTEIKDATFYDCPNLKDVWLSDNLSDIPPHMFKQSYGNYDADTSGITIHVKESLVEYTKNLYPDATVVAK